MTDALAEDPKGDARRTSCPGHGPVSTEDLVSSSGRVVPVGRWKRCYAIYTPAAKSCAIRTAIWRDALNAQIDRSLARRAVRDACAIDGAT